MISFFRNSSTSDSAIGAVNGLGLAAGIRHDADKLFILDPSHLSCSWRLMLESCRGGGRDAGAGARGAQQFHVFVNSFIRTENNDTDKLPSPHSRPLPNRGCDLFGLNQESSTLKVDKTQDSSPCKVSNTL